MPELSIIPVDAQNVEDDGFFCVKNKRHPGYKAKLGWLQNRFDEGMRLLLLRGDDGKEYGFIEYTPGEHAWRAVEAPGYLVIHCIWVESKKLDSTGNAGRLLQECIEDARARNFKGVAAVTSDGTWMADRRIYEKNGFAVVDEAEPHYQLLALSFGNNEPPRFTGKWNERLKGHEGLELFYTPQCPYVGKAVQELPPVARQHGVELKLTELTKSEEARQSMPSPYGVFNLVHDETLLADHAISATRFKNILQKDLGLKKVL